MLYSIVTTYGQLLTLRDITFYGKLPREIKIPSIIPIWKWF